MKLFSLRNIKSRAVFATGGIILLVMAVNTLVNIYAATSRYKESLIARTTALADGVCREIDKATGFGLPLTALEGMGDKLKGLLQRDKDLSGAMIMDDSGRVLYAGDRSLESRILSDAASKAALATNAPKVQAYSDEQGGHYENIIPLRSPDGKKIGVLRISLKETAVSGQMRSLLLWSLLVGLVSFLAATTLVYLFMDRTITRPITEMAKTATLMAAGDLTRDVPTSTESEIAELGSAINTMSSNLREMLRKVRATVEGLSEAMLLLNRSVSKMSQGARVQQESTENTAAVVYSMVQSIQGVDVNARDMSLAATNASSSAQEMASSIEEVAKNVVTLMISVDDTASSIEQMIASIKQVSENTDALSLSAEQTSSSVTEMSAAVKEVEQRAVESARLAEQASRDVSVRGMAAATESIRGMQNIREAVEATAAVVNRLGKRSQEIGSILKVIDEVTDQTALLALNAAILAAQAGEHGKGFGVVAEEIKDLAERTAASTREIADLITAVQEETTASVQAMNRGIKAVDAGQDLVGITKDVLEQVADSTRQNADMARAIEKTTAEQARGIAQITESSIGTADQIEQIAKALQEQRSGSDRIAQAAERMREIARQVRTATQEQSAGSRQIAGAVESVTGQAAQVARSTSEQTQGAQQIGESIANIQKITQDTVDVSIEMDIAAQTLKAKAEALQTELQGFRF
ncbi:MAG TPA: HAMP domain-containing methyl-accepting chemotaxis protein [Nitrospirota bacterium]|nr:HAMP domain-containing methyl-accepting chemotaxis protein [Nitrospirota bacterium]